MYTCRFSFICIRLKTVTSEALGSEQALNSSPGLSKDLRYLLGTGCRGRLAGSMTGPGSGDVVGARSRCVDV